MPIPTSINDLDPVAANNSPAGSDSPTEGDNYIRALSAIIAQETLLTTKAAGLADTSSASNGVNLTGYNPALSYSAGLGKFLNYTFSRSTAEVAAGVTPTNYAFPVGDVRRYGADPTGVSDCSGAFLNALKVGTLIIPQEGEFLALVESLLQSDNTHLIGLGGTIVRGAAIAASGSHASSSEERAVFYGNGKTGTRVAGLKFRVQSGQAHAQLGYFGFFDGCDDFDTRGCVFDSSIPGAVTNKESLAGHWRIQYSDRQVTVGNVSRYSYGNCFGAHGNSASATKGRDSVFSYNMIYNAVDTGIGLWTGCYGVTVVGNVFIRDDTSTAYNNVGIDIAGCYGGVIEGNTFRGGVIGIRCLSNLTYTNQRVKIIGNYIAGQWAGISSEPPTCIKVDHNDGTTTSQDMDVDIVGNELIITASGVGVNLVSTVSTLTKALTFKVDSNTIDISAASAIGVYLQQGSGTGWLRADPGKNKFVGAGAGSVPAAFVGASEKKSLVDQDSLACIQTSTLTAYDGSVAQPLNSMNCGQGVYATCASFGACTTTGTGSVLNLKTKAGAALAQNAVINAADANTLLDSMWNVVETPGTYRHEMDGGSGTCTTTFEHLSLVRII